MLTPKASSYLHEFIKDFSKFLVITFLTNSISFSEKIISKKNRVPHYRRNMMTSGFSDFQKFFNPKNRTWKNYLVSMDTWFSDFSSIIKNYK